MIIPNKIWSSHLGLSLRTQNGLPHLYDKLPQKSNEKDLK